MYDEANARYDYIKSEYAIKYGNSSRIGTRLIYAFDAVYAFAKVLHQLDNDYGGLDTIFTNENLINDIAEIIQNKTSFQSVTGLVSFNNETGDRDYGYYSFGYITDTGDVEHFGYSYYSSEGELGNSSGSGFVAVIDNTTIEWPKSFTDKGLIHPISEQQTTRKLSTISPGILYILYILYDISLN